LTTLNTDSAEFRKHSDIAESTGKRIIAEITDDITKITGLCRAPFAGGQNFDETLDALSNCLANMEELKQRSALIAGVIRDKNFLEQRHFELNQCLEDFRPKLKKAEKYIYLLETLDKLLLEWFAGHPGSDRQGILTETIIFAVRQSTVSLQSLLVVGLQNVAATLIIMKNIQEITKSLDQLSTITVSAQNVSDTIHLALSDTLRQAIVDLQSKQNG
jgi:hypothetical protein